MNKNWGRSIRAKLAAAGLAAAIAFTGAAAGEKPIVKGDLTAKVEHSQTYEPRARLNLLVAGKKLSGFTRYDVNPEEPGAGYGLAAGRYQIAPHLRVGLLANKTPNDVTPMAEIQVPMKHGYIALRQPVEGGNPVLAGEGRLPLGKYGSVRGFAIAGEDGLKATELEYNLKKLSVQLNKLHTDDPSASIGYRITF